MGYQLSDEEVNRAFMRFKEIADKKKEITSKDLEAILADEIAAVDELYQVQRLQVSCGYPAVPTATVAAQASQRRGADGGRNGHGPGRRELQGDREDH